MGDKKYILGLDISTKTIGIALYEDLGGSGELILLHHVTPKVKTIRNNKMEELFLKGDIFENDFLKNYTHLNIHRVIIEEPLLRSNNVNTVATLLKFNGIVSRAIYKMLGVVPDYISSYDARAFGFPELMAKRTHTKAGKAFTKAQIDKKDPVLFGGLPFDIDKKEIIWEKVSDLYPKIDWPYTKKMTLAKEAFDMSDAVAAGLGQMKKEGIWS